LTEVVVVDLKLMKIERLETAKNSEN